MGFFAAVLALVAAPLGGVAAQSPSDTPSFHATSRPDTGIGLSGCARLTALKAPSGKARSVREFGAVPDDDGDDTKAIQRALDALAPGEWLVFPPGRYLHERRLRVTVPGTRLWGAGAHLHATNPDDMALMLMADETGAYGFTLTAMTAKRGNRPVQARIAIHPPEGADIVRGVEVRGNRIVAGRGDDPALANAATTTGVFVTRAQDFLVAENYVERTLADGIHVTGGSASGRVVGNTVRETGDDMIAVVSYLGRRGDDPAMLLAELPQRLQRRLVRDVLIEGNDVAGQYWGRGIAVVGGRGITIRGNRIADTTHAAAIYVARETSFVTTGVADVLVEHNRIARVQTGAPAYVAAVAPAERRRTGHSAILVVAQISPEEARLGALVPALQVRDVTIRANDIDQVASDGIRIGAGGAAPPAGKGRFGDLDAVVPIRDVLVTGNRVGDARGRALALGAGRIAGLRCADNRGADGTADSACRALAAEPGESARTAGRAADSAAAAGARGADLACLRQRR